MTSMVAVGFTKLAVPTATPVAPARINSSASSAVVTPPMPMIGDLYGVGHLVDHTHSDGVNGRAGDAAGLIGQGEGTAVDIDLHTGEGIDEGNRIGSACLCCPGDLSDIRYVRGSAS